jgi:hypothetical protein
VSQIEWVGHGALACVLVKLNGLLNLYSGGRLALGLFFTLGWSGIAAAQTWVATPFHGVRVTGDGGAV